MADNERIQQMLADKLVEGARTAAIRMGITPHQWAHAIVTEIVALLMAHSMGERALDQTIETMREMYKIGMEEEDDEDENEEGSNPRIEDDSKTLGMGPPIRFTFVIPSVNGPREPDLVNETIAKAFAECPVCKTLGCRVDHSAPKANADE